MRPDPACRGVAAGPGRARRGHVGRRPALQRRGPARRPLLAAPAAGGRRPRRLRRRLRRRRLGRHARAAAQVHARCGTVLTAGRRAGGPAVLTAGRPAGRVSRAGTSESGRGAPIRRLIEAAPARVARALPILPSAESLAPLTLFPFFLLFSPTLMSKFFSESHVSIIDIKPSYT
jgi:hypothetical protein